MGRRLKRKLITWLYKWSLRKYREILNMPNFYLPKTVLSEHAIVRYLERVEGYDIVGLKQKLLTPELINMSNELGGNCRLVIDGIMFTIKDGKIVTINRPNSKLTPTVKGVEGHDIARRWSF